MVKLAKINFKIYQSYKIPLNNIRIFFFQILKLEPTQLGVNGPPAPHTLLAFMVSVLLFVSVSFFF